MRPLLHIVTQCTDRKKVPVPPELRLQRYRDRDISRRADAWNRALANAPAISRLRNLYSGEHWVTSLELEGLAIQRGFETRLWVVSAGLGLVAANLKAPAYSATFSSNVDDTVIVSSDDPATQRRAWLDLLASSLRGTKLEQLASDSPRAHFICALSRPYLQAVLHDLRAARRQLSDPDRLILVTGDAPEAASGELADSWVPSSSRLQHLVGGSRIGQHARVARKLLTNSKFGSLSANAWRNQTQQWLKDAPEARVFERTQLSDVDVRAFARGTPHSSWSAALRALRASGRACEQKRFRAIFKEERAT